VALERTTWRRPCSSWPIDEPVDLARHAIRLRLDHRLCLTLGVSCCWKWKRSGRWSQSGARLDSARCTSSSAIVRQHNYYLLVLFEDLDRCRLFFAYQSAAACEIGAEDSREFTLEFVLRHDPPP